MTKTAYQREWEAQRELDAAHRDLETAAGQLLATADTGRLITRATGVVDALSKALVRCRAARERVRDAGVEPAPAPKPEHAFQPTEQGHCSVCGKTWAGGHPPAQAPAIVEGGSL